MKERKGVIQFITDNRYKLSGAFLILLTLIQYFFTLKGDFSNEIGFPFNNKLCVAFYSNFKFFGVLLTSYELCYIITNKKRGTSFIGALMVTFSTAVQYNFDKLFIETLMLGQLIIILLNKFMTSEKFKTRLFSLIGTSVSLILYGFTYYSSYMMPMGYVFIALAIWAIIKNRKNKVLTKKDVISIVACVVFILTSLILYFVNSSNIEIEKVSRENGVPYLFDYLYSFLLPFKEMGDEALLANIISVFPIPMLMALYYVYNKEKHIEFLLPLATVGILGTVFCISGFPEGISKFLILDNVTVSIMSMAVGFANFYLLLYILSNIDEELFSIKATVRLAIIVTCIMVFIPLPRAINSRGYLSIVSGLLCLYTFLLLNNGDKKYRNTLLFFLLVFSLVGGMF